MNELSEDFNKELENMKKEPSEVNNTITEIKNKLEGINSRLEGTGKQISDLEDRVWKVIKLKSEKKKNLNETRLRDVWNNIK